MRLVVLAALAVSAPAGATTYKVNLTGILTEQVTDGAPSAYAVGSLIRLSARFDDAFTAQTPFGYSLAGFYPGAASGSNASFLIESDGGNWGGRSDINDGSFPFYTYDYFVEQADGQVEARQFTLAGPGIAFANGKVVGVAADLVPGGNTPELGSGHFGENFTYCFNLFAGGDVTCQSRWADPILTNHFGLAGLQRYTNTYNGPNFRGVWEFANSSVVAVPEPASWALMIVGFSLTSVALRGRSQMVKQP